MIKIKKAVLKNFERGDVGKIRHNAHCLLYMQYKQLNTKPYFIRVFTIQVMTSTMRKIYIFRIVDIKKWGYDKKYDADRILYI